MIILGQCYAWADGKQYEHDQYSKGSGRSVLHEAKDVYVVYNEAHNRALPWLSWNVWVDIRINCTIRIWLKASFAA